MLNQYVEFKFVHTAHLRAGILTVKKKNFLFFFFCAGAMNTTLERQQALANLMDLLHDNAAEDDDGDDSLHALVKALERNVADSNPVIAERTLLALDALVEQRGDALRGAMAELVPKVAERLGDRRDEVRTRAARVVALLRCLAGPLIRFSMCWCRFVSRRVRSCWALSRCSLPTRFGIILVTSLSVPDLFVL
jgi:hypothetical protein